MLLVIFSFGAMNAALYKVLDKSELSKANAVAVVSTYFLGPRSGSNLFLASNTTRSLERSCLVGSVAFFLPQLLSCHVLEH
jgi:hypothetical protein